MQLDFFNEELKDMLETRTCVYTPQDIVNKMIDELPKEVWSPDTKFFDPAVKSGVFLVTIYNRLMESESLIDKFPDRMERMEHILDKQLYGMAVDQMSCLISQRNLYGQMNPFGNIQTLPDYISLVKEKDPRNYINKVKQALRLDTDAESEDKEAMLFDVVIGNPPYQEASASIYQHFIELGLRLSKRDICMIVKNNWLCSDTLKDIRKNMVKNGLKTVFNYPEIGDVFCGVTPAVTIFNIDKEYKGKTCYKEIRNNKIVCEYNEDFTDAPIIFTNIVEKSIYEKISLGLGDGNFGSLTYPAECFRVNSNGSVGRGENRYRLNSYAEKSEEHPVQVVYMDSDREPYYEYIRVMDIPARGELLDKYKILCGGKISKDNFVIRNVNVVSTGTICSASWGMLYTGDDLENVRHVEKYIKTRLFRFLVRMLVGNGLVGISSYRFSLVPLQDFTSSSDIDWTRTIEEIDKQLYKKYNLSNEEIDYIEKTIKSMN